MITTIVEQPRPAILTTNAWMQGGVSGDLSQLAGINQLIVKQRFEPIEAVTSFETGNKYEVFNSNMQRLYYAEEATCCCSFCQYSKCGMCSCFTILRKSCFCGCEREFDIYLYDQWGKKIMQIHRPARCSSCCFPCCLQEVAVNCPIDSRIGTIIQNWSICLPAFSIMRPDGEVMLKIDGPCITCSCCGDVQFPITTSSGEIELGTITKNFSGIVTELLTDADNFTITFPADLDSNMKACLLATSFLLDFTYFEATPAER